MYVRLMMMLSMVLKNRKVTPPLRHRVGTRLLVNYRKGVSGPGAVGVCASAAQPSPHSAQFPLSPQNPPLAAPPFYKKKHQPSLTRNRTAHRAWHCMVAGFAGWRDNLACPRKGPKLPNPGRTGRGPSRSLESRFSIRHAPACATSRGANFGAY